MKEQRVSREYLIIVLDLCKKVVMKLDTPEIFGGHVSVLVPNLLTRIPTAELLAIAGRDNSVGTR